MVFDEMKDDLSKKMNWDELKEKMKKSIKLEKDEKAFTVKITLLEVDGIKENTMISGMIQDADSIKKSLGQFINNGKPVNCEIEGNPADKLVIIKLENKKWTKKVYDFFYDLFFGDFLKKMMDALMGAFGGMFGKDEK